MSRFSVKHEMENVFVVLDAKHEYLPEPFLTLEAAQRYADVMNTTSE